MTTRREWAKAFNEMTADQQATGWHLYSLGADAARRKVTITYTDAAESLRQAGLKYANPRGIGPALDALAGVCGTLDVPDLSALFHPRASFLSGRWHSLEEKEAERDSCYRKRQWPPSR